MKDGIIAVNVEGQGNVRIEYDNTAIGPRDILQLVQVNKLSFYATLLCFIDLST